MILQSPLPEMDRAEAVAYFALLTTAVGFTLAAVYGIAKLVASKLKRG
jgi:hypothetical protein